MTPGWIDTLFYYAYDITEPTYNKMMNPDLFLGGPHSICTPVLVRGTSEQVTLIFFLAMMDVLFCPKFYLQKSQSTNRSKVGLVIFLFSFCACVLLFLFLFCLFACFFCFGSLTFHFLDSVLF